MTADPNITRLMAEADADYAAAMRKALAECGSTGDVFAPPSGKVDVDAKYGFITPSVPPSVLRIYEQPECGRPGWLDQEQAPEKWRGLFWECVAWCVIFGVIVVAVS